MSERQDLDTAPSIYDLAIERLVGFSQGSFESADRRDFRRLALQLLPVKTIEDTLEADRSALKVILDPEKPKATEYTLDPANFLNVTRNEIARAAENPGIWDRLLGRTLRTQANEKDLRELGFLIDRAKPTPEFQAQIEQEQERRTVIEQERLAAMERERQVRLEAERLERAAQSERRTNEQELTKMRKAEQVASGVWEKSEKVEGDKCIGVIVEDFPDKVKWLRERYEEAKPNTDYSIIFHWIEDPEEAVRQIVALQKLSLAGPNLPVFVFMDGMLEGKYKTGMETAEALVAKLQEYNLPMPYLVGNAGDSWRNRELNERFPDNYVTTYARDYPLGGSIDYKTWELQPFMDIGEVIRSRNTESGSDRK